MNSTETGTVSRNRLAATLLPLNGVSPGLPGSGRFSLFEVSQLHRAAVIPAAMN
jgi:hypothetical protein